MTEGLERNKKNVFIEYFERMAKGELYNFEQEYT